MGTSSLGTVKTVTEEGNGNDRDGDVAGKEIRNAESANKSREAVEEQNDAEHDDANPCHVGLAVAAEGEVATVDALNVERALEAEEADADEGPRDQGAEGRKVRQPSEGIAGAAGDGHEGQQAKAQSHNDTNIGRAGLAGLEEDLGHGLLLSERHHGTGKRVGVFVSGRQSRSHDNGVDDRRQDADTSLLANDDEGRRGRGVTTSADGADELGRVLADVDANDDDSGDVESHDTVEDALGGGLHGLARVVSLAGDDTDGLDATVGESSLGEDLPESEEAGGADRGDVEVVVVPRFLTPVFSTGVHC